MLPAKNYSDLKAQKPEVRNPYVVNAGLSTPSAFMASVSPDNIGDGYLNRIVPFFAGDAPYWGDAAPREQLGQWGPEVTAALDWIAEARRQANARADFPGGQGFIDVAVTSDALAADKAFRDLNEAKRQAGDPTAPLGEGRENARRLALVLAVGEAAAAAGCGTAAEAPGEAADGGEGFAAARAAPAIAISGETMRLAVALVQALGEEYAYQVAGNVCGRRRRDQVAGPRHGGEEGRADGWARSRDVFERFRGGRFDGWRVQREVDWLVSSGQLEKELRPSDPRGGTRGVRYRLA